MDGDWNTIKAKPKKKKTQSKLFVTGGGDVYGYLS